MWFPILNSLTSKYSFIHIGLYKYHVASDEDKCNARIYDIPSRLSSTWKICFWHCRFVCRSCCLAALAAAIITLIEGVWEQSSGGYLDLRERKLCNPEENHGIRIIVICNLHKALLRRWDQRMLIGWARSKHGKYDKFWKYFRSSFGS